MTYLSIGLAILLYYIFFILPTQWLKVERIRYDCSLKVRILQISDIHTERVRITPKRLMRVIQEEKPDYIFLTGDFTELPRYVHRVEAYAKAVTSFGVPVFAVFGNHDHHLNSTDLSRLTEILERHGIRVLFNESISLDQFELIGIDDFTSGKSNIDQAFEQAVPDRPSIIITHDPTLVLYMKRHYTYLMAGHFHGKQFNIPFLFKIRNKGYLAARGIYKGLHQDRSGTFYISKGIGQVGINARFGVRSEVTVHDL